MRVCMISRSDKDKVITGVSTHIEYLAKALVRSGIDVEVKKLNYEDIIPEYFFVFISKLIIGESLEELKKSLTYPMKIYLNDLKKAVMDFDIVHAHNYFTYLDAVLCKLFFGKVIVLTSHELAISIPFITEETGKEKYRYLCSLEGIAMDMADAIISTHASRKMDILDNYHGVKQGKVSVIYNGIDIKEYTRCYDIKVLEKYGIDPTIPYIFFMAKVNRKKGVEYLLRAGERLFLTCQMVICVSPGYDEKLVEELEEQVEKLKAARMGVIVIKENLDVYTKKVIYSHAKVVCSPSIYEPSGLMILEAMACGAPIVASSVGGMKNLIRHGESGFLVEPGLSLSPPYLPMDEEGFIKRIAEATNRIMGDDALNKRLSMRARENVEKFFSWDIVGEKTLEIYRKFVKA